MKSEVNQFKGKEKDIFKQEKDAIIQFYEDKIINLKDQVRVSNKIVWLLVWNKGEANNEIQG